MSVQLRKIGEDIWEIPREGGMRVPGRVYASEKLVAAIRLEESLQQVVNVAHLPGIVGYSLAMPDMHWGYGFPIGGVAATRVSDGVISPGGVGYDINCGVRLARTSLVRRDVEGKLSELVTRLFQRIPTGVGSAGAIPKLGHSDLKRVLARGAGWAVENGLGQQSDLDHTEEQGALSQADPDGVSQQACDRGAPQLGTLGSGNHFLEVDVVDEIFLPDVADRMGIFLDQIAVIIHSGSRGLGYQVCDDYLKVMGKAMQRYRIELPDRQLACAPLESDEGRRYLGAMSAAANFAWANRQVMMHLAEQAFLQALGISPRQLGMSLVYDVCHNIAKFEEHTVEGVPTRVCVHRKGATRAFGPGLPQVPESYRALGQPVLIPGDMARGSFVLIGTSRAMEETFGSTCHGAGRVMSRTQSKKESRGRDLIAEMKAKGVLVMAHGRNTIAEEMPHAYKNVSDVVDVMDRTGISRKVARLRPLGVIKG